MAARWTVPLATLVSFAAVASAGHSFFDFSMLTEDQTWTDCHDSMTAIVDNGPDGAWTQPDALTMGVTRPDGTREALPPSAVDLAGGGAVVPTRLAHWTPGTYTLDATMVDEGETLHAFANVTYVHHDDVAAPTLSGTELTSAQVRIDGYWIGPVRVETVLKDECRIGGVDVRSDGTPLSSTQILFSKNAPLQAPYELGRYRADIAEHGDHNVTIQGVDAAGHTTATESYHVRIDLTGPEAAWFESPRPVVGLDGTIGAIVTRCSEYVAGVASDGIGIREHHWYVDGTYAARTEEAVVSLCLAAGQHEMRVIAFDRATRWVESEPLRVMALPLG